MKTYDPWTVHKPFLPPMSPRPAGEREAEEKAAATLLLFPLSREARTVVKERLLREGDAA